MSTGIKFGSDANTSNLFSFLQNDKLNTKLKVVRTRAIILNENSCPNIWKEYGEYASIGNIIFELPEFPIPSETSISSPKFDISNIKVAKPIFPNIKHYPLINELVYIIELVGSNINIDPDDTDYYYFPPLNIWNSNHHNALPNEAFGNSLPPSQEKDYQQVEGGSVRKVTDKNTDIYLGETFQEKLNIQPLQPYEGDILYEGRWGQALRFGSTIINSDSPWSELPSSGDPITILSNGIYNNGKDPWIPTLEDINKTPSSIWLSTTQKLPILVSSTLYKSYKPINSPLKPELYNGGEQIIINSGRVIINSKTDHTLISSKKSVGLNSDNSVNIDARDETSISSPSIILGNGDRKKAEPLLKGDITYDVLVDIIEALLEITSELSVLSGQPIDVPFLNLNVTADNINRNLYNMLSTKLTKIRSNISKTE
jgi:hypothetical protein